LPSLVVCSGLAQSEELAMRTGSRREFVKTTIEVAASVAAISLWETAEMVASPLGLPIGLQLYTVGKEMDADPAGTLKTGAAVGYKNVELSPLAKTPARDLQKMLEGVGLKNPSGHYMLPDLLSKLPQMIELAHLFGQEYMVVTVPWVADPSRFKPDPRGGE